MQDDTFPQGSLSQCGLSFLRTVPTRPEKTFGKKWRWEMCSEIFWISVFQVILFFKSSLRPWKEFIQRYLVVETFSQRRWWLLLCGWLHLRKVYNQKPCHKPNPSFGKKKTGSKKIQHFEPNTFSYKHLQKPLENHPHCICMGLPASWPCKMPQPPKNPSERPRFFLDVSLPYNGRRTLDKLEQKTPWVSNQKLISGLEKKTQVYRHIKTAPFYFMPFSWEKCQHLDLDETKVKRCNFFWDFLGDLFLPKLQGADYTQFG